MNSDKLLEIIGQARIEWSAHALRRMLERGISREEVKHIIATGISIEEYLDDKPFPSVLLFGQCQKQPLHVVLACDCSNHKVFLITAYRPDKKHFESDFKTRRK